MGELTTNAVPNPGSIEAVSKGCICAVIDNGHGRGFRGDPNVFVYTVGCPVHCPDPARAKEQETRG